MSYSICAACGEQSVTYDSVHRQIVCESCGVVVEQSDIALEVDYEVGRGDQLEAVGQYVSYTDGIAGASQFRRGMARVVSKTLQQEGRGISQKKQVKARISQLCALLKVPGVHKDEIFNNVETFVRTTNSRWIFNKKLDIKIGACIYITARQQSLPLTMLDLAEVIGVEVWVFGRTFVEVSNALKIEVPPLDPVWIVERSAYTLSDTLGDKKAVVTDCAARLIRLAQSQWLDSGRNPVAIAGSCFKLSCEAHDIKIKFETIAEHCAVQGVRAMSARYQELKNIILKLKDELPWGDTVTKKNLKDHLLFLVSHCEVLKQLRYNVCEADETIQEDGNEEDEGDDATEVLPASESHLPSKQTPTKDLASIAPTPSSSGERATETREKKRVYVEDNKGIIEPPAFSVSREDRNRRIEKIYRAKKRIQDCARGIRGERDTNGQADDGSYYLLDAEDLELERLLLAGCKEEDLEEGYFHLAPPEAANVSTSTELSEKDIPDHQLSRYIRSAEEVAHLRAVHNMITVSYHDDESEHNHDESSSVGDTKAQKKEKDNSDDIVSAALKDEEEGDNPVKDDDDDDNEGTVEGDDGYEEENNNRATKRARLSAVH